VEDFTKNDTVLKDMRICLRFFANTTHTKLEKKPEEYTMEEMLDVMDKMKKKFSTRWGRFKLAMLDFLKTPGFYGALFVVICFLIAFCKVTLPIIINHFN